MAKNTTHKKDKTAYRPWRSKVIEFNNCYSCGIKIQDTEQKFCQPCMQKLNKGYDLW